MTANGQDGVGLNVPIRGVGSQPLAWLDGHVELHDKQLIFGLAQNLVQKPEACAALGLEHVLLAHAGIDHQPDS